MGTNLSSCSKHSVHTPVSLRKPLRCGLTVVVCSCLLFGASRCRAQETQDAAAAARQESARKAQQKQRKHVYTEDDLGRAKILTPEDEARFAASRKEQIGPADGQTSVSLDASAELPQLPLGDIARRYRDAKRAMQAPTAFHLPFDEPAFASPIVPVSQPAPPRPSFSPAHPNVLRSQPKVAVAPAISSPAPLHRVDPFARRSAPAAPSVARVEPTGPTAPLARPSVSRVVPAPVVRQPNVSGDVAAPKVASPGFAVPAAPVSHPSVPRVAPVPEVRRPNLSGKIRAPKFELREFAFPKFAPTPAAPEAVAPEIAPLTGVEKTASLPHTLTVQRGDSLWKLAQQHLGRGSRWQELLVANPGIVDPKRLAAGTQIVVPTEPAATLKITRSDSKVAVQKGDTLSAIARANYGRGAAWRCIAQANPQIANANRIYEGQQLLLPFKCDQ